MPVVIEEMTVQVEVNQNRTTTSGPNVPGQSAYGPEGDPNKNQIRQCVEEVMEVLRHQKER